MTRSYTHNAANQRTEIVHEGARRWAYEYDDLGQVESAQKQYDASATSTPDWQPLPGYAQAFAYDDIGNRESTTTNGRLNSYTSDALNRYLARGTSLLADVRGNATAAATVLVNDERATRTGEDFYLGVPVLGLKENALKIQAATTSPHQATTQTRSVLVAAVPEAFAYDADGNLLKDGLWNYEWDAENRLVAQELRADVSTSTWKRLEYSYDKESRRIRKVVKTKTSPSGSWTTASDTRFLYDGWNLLAEYSYASSTFTLLRSHAWGLDLSGSPQGAGGVGGLLWTTVASTAKTYAATADANGNIIAYIDCADDTISGKRDYSAFGEAVVTTGVAGSLPFGFSSKYEEKETGLYYYGFRYYNPQTGRWPSRDPIGIRGGLNLYGMIGNDAINGMDRLGLLKVREISRSLGNCGIYDARYAFDLDGPAKEAGYIVQEITISGYVVENGSREDVSKIFYESWSVYKGASVPSKQIRIKNGKLETGGWTDKRAGNKACSEGSITIKGIIRFYHKATTGDIGDTPPTFVSEDGRENYSDPKRNQSSSFQPNNVAEAGGGNLSSINKPDWWNQTPLEETSLTTTATWNCMDDDKSNDLTKFDASF